MKFPWLKMAIGPDARPLPIVRCGFRNGLLAFPGDVLAILDTGADNTVLPKQIAPSLGYLDQHLDVLQINAVGGKATTWKVKDVTGLAVNIGGFWLDLPCLTFAENTPPLLGRDVIFANFDLRMCEGETELRPKPRPKR